jgi:hypothetical protein
MMRSDTQQWFRKLEADAKFGAVGSRCLALFQEYHGLTLYGGFGPKTRGAAFARYHFDFQAAVRATPGVTIFVQPDGSEIMFVQDRSGIPLNAHKLTQCLLDE